MDVPPSISIEAIAKMEMSWESYASCNMLNMIFLAVASLAFFSSTESSDSNLQLRPALADTLPQPC